MSDKTDKTETTALATTPGAVQTPDALVALAIEKDLDVDKLERLLKMKQDWDAQQAREAFVEAMTEFQRRCPKIDNTKEVHTKGGGLLYKYAPLTEIISKVRDLENELGFSHRFDTVPMEGGGAQVTCIVTHRRGHSETTTVTIPPTKGMNTNAAQDHGIAITYGERYAFRGAFGIVTGMLDTDGAPASDDPPLTQKQINILLDLLTQCPDGTLDDFLKWGAVAELTEFPAGKYNEAVRLLKKKAGQNGGAA